MTSPFTDRHVYNKPGVKTITVDDGVCSVSTQITVFSQNPPALIVSPTEVDPGDNLTVAGSGLNPNTTCGIQVWCGTSGGQPVTSAVQVTTDADGNFGATTIQIPVGATCRGPARVEAQSGCFDPEPRPVGITIGSGTGQATVAVSPDPVNAGDNLTVAGSGYAPGSQVTIQLEDPQGSPIGAPVVVAATAAGDIPAGTVLPIPADAASGTYGVRASDGTAAGTAETTVQVIGTG